MATEQVYSGNNSTKTFSITFPFLKEDHVNAKVGGTDTSAFTISGTNLTFTTAPPTGTDNVVLYRDTPIVTPEHTYQAGTSIRSTSLNDNQKQVLYAVEEAKLVTVTSGGITTGAKGDIRVNSDSNWVITDDAVEKAMMADNSVGTAQIETNAVTALEIAADAVGTSEIAANAVGTSEIADNAITMAKLGSGALPTDITVDHGNIVADAIRNAEIKDGEITLAKLAATVANLINTAAPVGTIIYFSGLYPPIGYIKANGDTIGSTTTTFAETDAYKQVNADYTGTSYIGTINTALLYKLVGNKLPDLRGQFVRGYRSANTNIDNSGTTAHSSSGGLWSSSYGTNTVLRTQTEDFKGFHMKSEGIGPPNSNYSHEAYMGKETTNYDPDGTNRLFTGKWESSDATGLRMKWDTSEIRPMNIALLACIKY